MGSDLVIEIGDVKFPAEALPSQHVLNQSHYSFHCIVNMSDGFHA